MLEGLSQILALATIAAQVLIGVFILILIARGKKAFRMFRWLSEIVAMKLTFLISLGAVLATLYYSEILTFEPCVLCWYQRIFMYGLVVLLAVALWRSDKNIVPYAMTFAILGGLIALYQYLLQITPLGDSDFCSIFETSVSCSDIWVLHFGYITIPAMALTGFAVIALLLFISGRKK